MAESALPITGERSPKEQLILVADNLIRRVRRVPAQVVDAVHGTNRILDSFEDEFGKRSTQDKMKLVFAVVAVATAVPGGYIALQLWAARRVVKWIAKRRSHSPVPEI